MPDENINDIDEQEDVETTDQGEENQDQTGDDSKPTDTNDESKESEKDTKAHNRKGYETRKNKSGENTEDLQKTVADLTEKVTSLTEKLDGNEKDQAFRKAHPHITDEFFNSLKAQAKGLGKSYEEALEDPVFKGQYETLKSTARVNGAQTSPSNRVSSSKSNNWADADKEAFDAKRNEVLSGM